MAVYNSKYNGAELDGALDDALSHIQNKNNPHSVTKSQVGLGNVDNTADADKSVAYAASAGEADIKRYDAETPSNSQEQNINIAALKAAWNDFPSDKGFSVWLKHGSRALGFGWKLGGYDINVGFGGWFVSNYDVPTYIGLSNGYWSERQILLEGDIPSSLPANGGNSATVNNHTVLSDVPANAVFTDTNTWRPLGTGATDACAGNDNRLSDARIAANIKVDIVLFYGDAQVDLGYAVSALADYTIGSVTFIYNNETSTDCIITVPTTYTGYTIRTPDGNPIELTCPAGGYCEVSVLKNNLMLFIRGI